MGWMKEQRREGLFAVEGGDRAGSGGCSDLPSKCGWITGIV